jgi:N-acetylglutamate synthase-like GNAT family acetyltransferase
MRSNSAVSARGTVMDAGDVILEPLPGDGLDDLAATLHDADLPHRDLAGTSKRFFCASVGGEIVGYVGLEISGADALLRSAVIFIHARHRGLGRAMVERLLANARDYGIMRVWLLTTSARGFFAKLGFADIDRVAVPTVIAASEEFALHCPTSAACMIRNIGAEAPVGASPP